MNRRRLLAILGAIVLTLFGTIVIVAYVNSAENRAREGTELVTVLVATEEIPAGTAAEDLTGSVAPRDVPVALRAEDAVRNLGSLGGQVTLERILQGELIVSRQFGDSADGERAGRSGLNEGREIVSIALEPQRALNGELAQGDFVGVVVSLEESTSGDGTTTTTEDESTTAMVLTGVRVTSVDGGVDPEGGEAASTVTVSLEVDQSEAERIVFGAEFGRVWLTRQAEEGPGPNDRRQTRDNIFDVRSGS